MALFGSTWARFAARLVVLQYRYVAFVLGVIALATGPCKLFRARLCACGLILNPVWHTCEDLLRVSWASRLRVRHLVCLSRQWHMRRIWQRSIANGSEGSQYTHTDLLSTLCVHVCCGVVVRRRAGLLVAFWRAMGSWCFGVVWKWPYGRNSHGHLLLNHPRHDGYFHRFARFALDRGRCCLGLRVRADA